MRSQWIKYEGTKIFYQNFSKLFYNSAAIKAELEEVQKVVKAEPLASILVLSDLRDTNVGTDLIPVMNAASAATKDHIRKTAVLGMTGVKRKLADLLTSLTGQPLKYFDDMESAKKWLAEE
ncbi:MAG TPA: STAS/SEC14 domain-containing protein [Anaerolineales bacterium]